MKNIYISLSGGIAQSATYNGHKICNEMKIQAMSAPEGPIVHTFRAEEGGRLDITPCRHSEGEDQRGVLIGIACRQYYIYGDPEYVLRACLHVAFGGADLSNEQRSFNTAM